MKRFHLFDFLQCLLLINNHCFSILAFLMNLLQGYLVALELLLSKSLFDLLVYLLLFFHVFDIFLKCFRTAFVLAPFPQHLVLLQLVDKFEVALTGDTTLISCLATSHSLVSELTHLALVAWRHDQGHGVVCRIVATLLGLWYREQAFCLLLSTYLKRVDSLVHKYLLWFLQARR